MANKIKNELVPRTGNLKETNKYRKDKLTGKSTYKAVSLPMWIHNILHSIFIELRYYNLLSKYLHGETQNANDVLNNLIWRNCPKNVFVERSVL